MTLTDSHSEPQIKALLGAALFATVSASAQTGPPLQNTPPAFAPVPNAPASSEGEVNENTRHRHFGPIKEKADHLDGTAESENWSGYAVTGSDFTSASASWIVPAAVCKGNSNQEYAAFWVGLDGYSSNIVEQIGTDSDCDGPYPSYYAWYEFNPGASITLSLAVYPGNKMSATVSYSDSKFTVSIVNETTGKSYSKTAAMPGAERSSAEWITEAPCCNSGGGVLPLSDFGTVLFGFDYTSLPGTNSATETSHGGNIGSFGAANIHQITKNGSSSSPQTSTCSPLSSDGTSFSCTWAAQ